MTVHFFTKGTERISDSRQRAFEVMDLLNENGTTAIKHGPTALECSETPWPKKYWMLYELCRSLSTVQKDDVIFLQRTISNKYFVFIVVVYLLLFRRKMIFDFDDAIYLHCPNKTKLLTWLADAVIVCSVPLKEWASKYNKNVHIIHTTVKLEDYLPYTKEYSQHVDKPVIGWVGTAKDHYHNLAFLALVFRQLPKDSFKFKFVGKTIPQNIRELFKPFDTEFVEYVHPSDMPKVLQSFDIGVNPLPDKTEWNLARSSFKPYEYMAIGLAQVTSATGEITRVIDGKNGYLAHNSFDFAEGLKELLTDRKKRYWVGVLGQNTMIERESLEAVLPKYISIIQNV